MTDVDDRDAPLPSSTPSGAAPAGAIDAAGDARKPGKSDDALRIHHRNRPAIGELVIDVRAVLIAKYGPTRPYAGLAQDIRERKLCPGGRKARLVAQAISAQCIDPAGFSSETVQAVLLLAVPEDQQREKAMYWAGLIEKGRGERVTFETRHDVVEVGDPPVPDPTAGPAPPAPRPPLDEAVASKDPEIARLALQLLELRTSPIFVSARRYEVLNPHEPATRPQMEAAIVMLAVGLSHQAATAGATRSASDRGPAPPELVNAAEDMARTAERWRETGVSPSQWTVKIPPSVWTWTALIYAILTVGVALASTLLGYQAIGNLVSR